MIQSERPKIMYIFEIKYNGNCLTNKLNIKISPIFAFIYEISLEKNYLSFIDITLLIEKSLSEHKLH